MLIDSLLDFFEAAFNWAVDLFPSSSFDPVAAFSSMLTVLGGLDYFLPIHELAGIIVAFLLLGAPLMLMSLVIWLIALARGGSAQG